MLDTYKPWAASPPTHCEGSAQRSHVCLNQVPQRVSLPPTSPSSRSQELLSDSVSPGVPSVLCTVLSGDRFSQFTRTESGCFFHHFLEWMGSKCPSGDWEKVRFVSVGVWVLRIYNFILKWIEPLRQCVFFKCGKYFSFFGLCAFSVIWP